MSDELLDHIIEESFRLGERLNTVSGKSNRRKKQILQLTRSMASTKAKVDLLERGNIEKSRQINLYAQDLIDQGNQHKEEIREITEVALDLQKQLDDVCNSMMKVIALEQVIELPLLPIEEKQTIWTKLQKFLRL